MSEETNKVELTDEEAQERIRNMFLALDAIYKLHGPDQASDPWICQTCSNCDGDVAWPCETEKIILDSLGVTNEA